MGLAELVYRQNRDVSGFDFSLVVVGFCKALELHLKDVLFAPAGLDTKDLPLGKMINILSGGDRTAHAHIRGYIRQTMPSKEAFLLRQLPNILSKPAEIRNRAAHEGTALNREQAEKVRDQILGREGHREGLINRLLDISS